MKTTTNSKPETQNPELAILPLADYSEKFQIGDASAYLIVNKHMDEYQCMFGFVELPDNFDTAQKLFTQIEHKAKELGYQELIGPLNYTTWLSYRWALDHPEIKIYPDCDNPSYCVDFIEKLGYEKLYTYRSATIKIDNKLYELGAKSYQQKLQDGFEFRFVKGTDVTNEIKAIYDISIAAFAGGPLYSELPYPYFEQIYLQWMKQVEPVAYIAYKDGKAVGFVMGYMNPYSNDFVSKTSAVLPEYQHQGIYMALVYLGCEYVKSLSLDEMIFHYQCEQRSTFQRFADDKESHEKHYAIFKKDLS